MNPPADTSPVPATTPDLDLLRRFEPVVYYTKGEQFYPGNVEDYVRECSLWEHHPNGRDELLIPQGELSLDKLTESRPAEFGSVRFLRFVEPLDLTESAQVLASQLLLRLKRRNNFHVGIGRLARGGFLPRLADGLFSLSFLLRGRVSAATAAAAELDYDAMFEGNPRYTYYGRVIRDNGWVVLQYWFFFYFNSWRSGFHGVNDHESDWELINVYLYEKDGQLVPEWAAYASHDYKGDDLRRHWNDRDELTVEGGHPVTYAGAGSHASYFRRGEYQAEVSLPMPGWFSGLLKAINKFWTETLGQPTANSFRIPFVDFARGDGLAIGPGQKDTWSPVQIDESTPWVGNYRGLWGLFARDPISGENAPAGPMYNRDGSPRGSWYDPLGFAGLDKVPPPPQALAMLRENCQKIDARQQELESLVPEKANELQALGIKQKGMEDQPHFARQFHALEKKLAVLADEVRALRRERSENAALLQSLTRRLARLESGEQDNARSHIRHLAVPVSSGKALRFDDAAETWAAISLSLMLFAIAAFIFLTPKFFWVELGIITILFLVTESILRGMFIQTVSHITLVLAMIAALILFFHFWKWVIVAALVAMGISLMIQRLRELTG